MIRFRAPLAFLCGILCVIGLVLGIAYAYVSRVLFDPDRFADRFAYSLSEPAVAGVIADQITDQILAAERDLTPYRPVLRGTIEYIVASAPFRAVMRRAAEKSHETLISPTGENLSLSVADLGVIVRNALSTYPHIADKIPARAQVAIGGIGNWPTGKRLLRVLALGRGLRLRAAIWLSVGFVLGTCGAFLAWRRDRYLLRVGLGLAITAMIVAAVARFGGGILALSVKSPVVADLVRGLWPAFIGPLAFRMVLLAGIGLIIVAGVTSLLQKVNLDALSRGLWRRIDAAPQRARWGLPRAALFIVVGILVALNPGATLTCFTVIAGSLLFFVGVQELFTIAMRAFERAQARLEAAQVARGPRIPSGVVVGGLVLALAAAGGVWLSRQDDGAAVAAVRPNACNGHPELCDRRLDEVSFAASHNSMAAADIPDWMFPNHEKGIRSQLEAGIRGFMLDVHYGVSVGDRVKTLLDDEQASMEKYKQTLGEEGVAAAMRIRDRMVGEESGERDVYLGHGFCELGAQRFVDALEIMREFLVANPYEVVILIIQDEGVAPADIEACFARSELLDFVYRGAVTRPWPTLREMVASDQRVLVFAENRVDSVPWYHLAFDVFQETPYRFLDPSEFSNRPGRGGKSGSLLLMNHWIETAPAPKPSNAEIVNAYDFLLARARACQRERGMMPNLIAVDFYRTGDLVRVVDTMNGIGSGAARRGRR